MRAVHLKLAPFEFVSILEWDGIESIGEHGALRIKGIIAEDNRQKYYQMSTSETWIMARAVDENGEEQILFNGVLTNLSIQSQHEFHTMEIEIKTGSFLLDHSQFIRSFQDSGLTLQKIMDDTLSTEKGQVMIHDEQGINSIGGMLLQYHETSWQFAKRVASRFGLPILPEFNTKGRRFYIGLPPKGKLRDITTTEYQISSSSQFGRQYSIQQREIYPLGARYKFDNNEVIVTTAKRHLVGGELINFYTLSTVIPTHHLQTNHFRISGLSLQATVTDVKNDRVQVKLRDDANQANAGHRWFNYATVHSTPDGTGWYMMPCVDDEVRLVFPNPNESGAYVASSVHLETDQARINPDHKSWKNPEGMEILFTPDAILVTTNNGTSFEVSDTNGINMTSDKGITISSNNQISLNSGSTISVSATDQLNIQQQSTRIHLQDTIDISGGKINLNN